jgi:Mor family transcriptional regulator
VSALIDTLIAAGVPEQEIDRFVAHWGGVPLYIPQRIDDEHQLVVLAGRQLALALAAAYGGERLVVPLGAAWRRERLRRKVAELAHAGLNHVEIARRLGLHIRQVQRLARAARVTEA